jgi:hypothetical protein
MKELYEALKELVRLMEIERKYDPDHGIFIYPKTDPLEYHTNEISALKKAKQALSLYENQPESLYHENKDGSVSLTGKANDILNKTTRRLFKEANPKSNQPEQLSGGMKWVKATERLPVKSSDNQEFIYCVRFDLKGRWIYGSALGRDHILSFQEWLDETPQPSTIWPEENEVKQAIENHYAHDGIFFSGTDYELADTLNDMKKVALWMFYWLKNYQTNKP